MSIYCQPREESRSLALILSIGVGSRYEDESINGISHFVEHMIFDGTEKWDEKEIRRIIRGIGGKFNGYTSKESTYFYTVISSQYLDTALDWLSQLAFHPTMPEGMIIKERNTIFQEEYNRRGWLLDLFDSLGFGYDIFYTIEKMIFPDNPLNFKIIGDDKALACIDRGKLVDWHRKYYLPNNSTLVVVGGTTLDDVYGQALRYFGDLKKGRIPPPPRTPPLHRMKGNTAVIMGPLDSDICTLIMGFKTQGYTSADYWPLRVLAEYLGQLLKEEIRIERGLAYYIWSYNIDYTDAGYFVVHTRSKEQDVKTIRSIVNDLLDEIGAGNIDLEMLEEVKNAVKGRWILSMEDNYSRARWINKWLLARCDSCSMPDFPSLIESVTAEDLNRILREYRTDDLSFSVEHIPFITVGKGAKALAVIVGAILLTILIKKIKR